MNLHEYQAKDLLRKYNLPILEGKSYIENVDDLEKDLQNGQKLTLLRPYLYFKDQKVFFVGKKGLVGKKTFFCKRFK